MSLDTVGNIVLWHQRITYQTCGKVENRRSW